jgi:hypothetical protein
MLLGVAPRMNKLPDVKFEVIPAIVQLSVAVGAVQVAVAEPVDVVNV